MSIYRKGSSRRGGVLAGCLIALGVVVVLVIAGGVFVAMNWRGWASEGMRSGMDQALAETTISQEEQSEIKAVVDSFCTEFENGQVSLEQFGKVFERLGESPILPAATVEGVNSQYVNSSDLSDEEKAEGSKHLSRFVRGVFQGDISQTKIDDVAEPISAPLDHPKKMSFHAGNINLELKPPSDVTTEELQAFLANAKAEADAAGVPDERYEIDWSAELQLVIDRAMGRAADPVETDGGSEGDGETGEG